MLTVQHSMHKMTPFLPFLNKIDFIILLLSLLSAKSSHLAMFDGEGIFVCARRRRGGGVLRLNS